MKANAAWRKFLTKGKRPKKPAAPSIGEETLAMQLRALDLPQPERQYQPVEDRRWKVDFAWPMLGIIVEVEGGVYMRGYHNFGEAMENDMRKYNRLKSEGWQIYQFSTGMVKSGEAITFIENELGKALALLDYEPPKWQAI